MSQLDFDPSDPLQVAVKVVRMEEKLEHTASNLGKNVEGMRDDLRRVGDRIAEMNQRNAESHAAQLGHSSGLERAFAAIRELAETTSSRFESERDELEDWKRLHEEDNRKTREKMILWSGIATGVSTLATTLITILIFVYNNDRTTAEQDRRRIEAEAKARAVQIENEMRANSASQARAIREVERYLTQEGTISNRPYTPSR